MGNKVHGVDGRHISVSKDLDNMLPKVFLGGSKVQRELIETIYLKRVSLMKVSLHITLSWGT